MASYYYENNVNTTGKVLSFDGFNPNQRHESLVTRKKITILLNERELFTIVAYLCEMY